MDRLYYLAEQFRNAMDCAKEAGYFENEVCFKSFPKGSCGETCYLLAEYLLDHGIYTEYVEGMNYSESQSHAWLVVADKADLERKRNEYSTSIFEHDEQKDCSNGYEFMLRAIQGKSVNDFDYTPHDYASDLHGRIIIDITGDQFHDNPEFKYYDIPVYVGEMDDVNWLFEIKNIHECTGLDADNSYQLRNLYRIIKEYIGE